MRSTITEPSFDFAFTDPAKDLDVSAFVQNHGGVELGITKVGYSQLARLVAFACALTTCKWCRFFT